MYKNSQIKLIFRKFVLGLLLAGFIAIATPGAVFANTDGGNGGGSGDAFTLNTNCKDDGSGKQVCSTANTNGQCGEVKTSLNYGCKGTGNGIFDIGLALIRFLTIGIGLVLTGLTVFTGIQYVTAQGDPSVTAKAKTRLLDIVIALGIYLLSFAAINYLVPGKLFG